MTQAVSMVFFPAQAGAHDLDWAREALGEQGLTVATTPRGLEVSWGDDGPLLRVAFARGDHVAEEAAEIAEGGEFEDAMRGCAARFEIAIDDLDEALDEMNTLIEVQATLQQATAGYLFNSWNRELSA